LLDRVNTLLLSLSPSSSHSTTRSDGIGPRSVCRPVPLSS